MNTTNTTTRPAPTAAEDRLQAACSIVDRILGAEHYDGDDAAALRMHLAFVMASIRQTTATAGKLADLAIEYEERARKAEAAIEAAKAPTEKLFTEGLAWHDRAKAAEAERDRLRAALADMLASASGEPKSCGHHYHCVCPTDAARAALAECGGGR